METHKPLFEGLLFVVPDDFFSLLSSPHSYSSLLRSLIEQEGGRLRPCYTLETAEDDTTTTPTAILGIQYSEKERGDLSNFKDAARLKGDRVPVVYSRWVEACITAQQRLPLKEKSNEVYQPHFSFLCYDPYWLEQVRFTTTQLPKRIKYNVIAMVQFYGGRYEPNLMTGTDMLVYMPVWRSPALPSLEGVTPSPSSPVSGGGKAQQESPKLQMAKERGIACASLKWLQTCVQHNQLFPLTPEYASLPSFPPPKRYPESGRMSSSSSNALSSESVTLTQRSRHSEEEDLFGGASLFLDDEDEIEYETEEKNQHHHHQHRPVRRERESVIPTSPRAAVKVSISPPAAAAAVDHPSRQLLSQLPLPPKEHTSCVLLQSTEEPSHTTTTTTTTAPQKVKEKELHTLLVTQLSLSSPTPPVKRGRGRPRKDEVQWTAMPYPGPEPIKRSRGRPRKMKKISQ